jgi:electron transport complex protein RnfG
MILALFAVLGAELVSFTYRGTAAQITHNRRTVLLRSLNAILPPERYDNDLLSDTVTVYGRTLLGTEKPVTVYRAWRKEKPVAVVLMPVAPDGYGGAIRLLLGIYYDSTVAGVRVLEHHETPGLGDAIEAGRSDWILQFSGRSLLDPPAEQWKVRRDGGEFDQFTGATVTPRAVVKAIYNSLRFYNAQKLQLFARTE